MSKVAGAARLLSRLLNASGGRSARPSGLGRGRRSFASTPVALSRGPKFRVHNEDRDLPIASSDDEDRRRRKYVFVSDDDARLFEEDERETDDDAFYAAPARDALGDGLWSQLDEESLEPPFDPDAHFREWRAQAERHEEVETRGLQWAEAVLRAARQALRTPPLEALALRGLSADPVRRQTRVTLDKFADPYGSPTLEEMTAFVRTTTEILSDDVGAAVAESLQLEVSSPGAERAVRLPFELERFRHLPMKVVRRLPDGAVSASVLDFQRFEEDGAVAVWRHHDGRHNRKVRRLRASDFLEDVRVRLEDVVDARLFLDL